MPPIEILFEDEWLLVVMKPSGWETVVQPRGGAGKGGATASGRCLVTRLRRQTGCPALEPAHRLDRDTSGLQLLGKDRETASRLHAAFRARRVEKDYFALCLGVPPNASGTIRRRLSRWGGGRRAVRVVKGRGGLEAETAYERLAFNDPRSAPVPCSLLLFKPRHGRTHQVRVHASALGYPVLGDDQYGDRRANREVKHLCGLRRQALHAWRLALPHPRMGERVEFAAPLPADLRRACELLLPGYQPVTSGEDSRSTHDPDPRRVGRR